jgi:hypothetical protein
MKTHPKQALLYPEPKLPKPLEKAPPKRASDKVEWSELRGTEPIIIVREWAEGRVRAPAVAAFIDFAQYRRGYVAVRDAVAHGLMRPIARSRLIVERREVGLLSDRQQRISANLPADLPIFSLAGFIPSRMAQKGKIRAV